VFDLHSHILPGIDDGSPDLNTSLNMARMAVANGVKVQACTPHIMPGVYNNTGPAIKNAVVALQSHLERENIPLRLVSGADVHIGPDLVNGLKSGHLLTIADSRYVLLEPPHHVAPARLVDMFFGVMVAGYQPILTHPERLGWIRSHYQLIEALSRGGVWMQITASSLTGSFGREPLYWSERMLQEGKVHILASDAHNTGRRPPNLLDGHEAAVKRVGHDEAARLVSTRPLCVLNDNPPSSVPGPVAWTASPENFDDNNHRGERVGRDEAPETYNVASLRTLARRLRRLVGRSS
jgi:protein-tyrosine phosphatase